MRRCLGPIPCPGSIEAFADSLYRHPQSVLRYHRDAWQDGPAAVPHYRLAVPASGFSISPDAISSDTDANPSGGQRPRPSQRLAYVAGDYFIQDPGSLLALSLAGADGSDLEGKRILDLCAAPGGKATALVEAVGGDGFVLANEVIQSRLAPLAFNLTRTGSPRYAISRRDPEDLAAALPGAFDLVMVDAPCSGQALLGRGKQSDAALQEKPIAHSAARQHRILDSAVRLTKPGGQIVYSTCTFAFEENEAQVQRLVDSGLVVASENERLADYQTHPGCYRTWPHRDQGAGSFAACMTVIGEGGESRTDQVSLATAMHPRESARRRSRRLSKYPDSVPTLDWGDWHPDPPSETIWMSGKASWIGFPADAPSWVKSVACEGPTWAYLTGKTWRPSHGVARRRPPFAVGAKTVELDDDQAVAVAQGHPVARDGIRGWRIATWHGRPLGWLKFDGRQGKNYLPAAVREANVVSENPIR